jgi:hypothetical protein
VGIRYWRHGAVALAAVLTLITVGAGAVLAADPQADEVVFDGVVTVHWADIDHGPMAGAVVRVFYYNDGNSIPGIVPLGDPMDADGLAVITGVPLAAPGSTPLLLDIRGDLRTSTIDEEGCTRIEGWLAQAKSVPAGLAVDVVLETEAQSRQLNCPDPATRPSPGVVGFPPSSSGNILGATGRPQITPPATDVTGGGAPPVESPPLPAILALVVLATMVVPAASLAFVQRYSRHR